MPPGGPHSRHSPAQWVGRPDARLVPLGHSRGTFGLTRMFSAARWALAADGRALLVPAPPHLASDLQPLRGTWAQVDDGLLVEVRRDAGPHRAVSVRGRIAAGAFTGRYTLVVGDDVHEHDVTVALSDDPADLDAAGVREVGGVPLPVELTGTLAGTSGGEAFALAVGVLLKEPVAGAALPVEFMVAAEDHVAVGSVLWMSGATGLHAEQTGVQTVTLDGGVLDVSVESDTDAASGVVFAVPGDPRVAVARLTGQATPRRARLRLAVGCDGADVLAEGTVHLLAHQPSGPVTLEATLTARGTVPARADLEPDGFERRWTAAAPEPGPVADEPPHMPRTWRDERDDGFALALARRRKEARPLLESALAGCRAERAAAPPGEHTNLLTSERNILTWLLSCHDTAPDTLPGPGAVDAVARLLVETVDVLEELAADPTVRDVLAHGAHGSMVALTDVVDRHRDRLDGELDRLAVGEAAAGAFDRLVPLLVRLDRPDAALVAAERASARVFADLVAARDPRPSPLPVMPAGRGVEALTARELREAVAGYGATTVAYHLTADAGTAWVLTPDGRAGHAALPAGAVRVAALLAALHGGGPDLSTDLSTDLGTDLGTDLDAAALAGLAEVLVAPLPPDLLPPPGGTLAVVAHRGVHAVPFAALPGPDGEPLVTRWAFATLPSIGTAVVAGLTAPPRPAAPPATMAALLAPRLDGGHAPLDVLAAAAPAFTRLLPDAVVRSGTDATPAALARDGAGRDLLLLGTHGVVDPDPARTHLVLAADATGDGRAYAGELARMRLDARLAVLLACEGAGGRITGDGVLGLSRGFLLAGCRSLVSALWPVGDRQAAALGYALVAAWARDGLGPAAALRRAQLEMREDLGGQPRHWAGFVLSGGWR